MNFSNFSFFSLIFLSFTYSSNYNLPNSCQDCGPAGNERLPTLPGLRQPSPQGSLVSGRLRRFPWSPVLCVPQWNADYPADPGAGHG